MKQRVITATILCCVLIPLLFFGSYFMIALTMFLSFMGVYELIKMYNQKHKISNVYKYILPIITSIISGIVSLGFYLNINLILYVALPLFVVTMLLFLVIAMFDSNVNMTDMIVMFGFILYGGLSFSLLSGLRFIALSDQTTIDLNITSNYNINLVGLSLIGYALVVSSTTDMAAQFGGILFGKHKLCPTISPKKTIEGALSGLLGGAICGTTVLFVCQIVFKFNLFRIDEWYISIPLIFVVSLILSCFGQVGDLVASKIKREHDIKDYGNIFPGHGGVLDRFDSAIFVCLTLISIIFVVSIAIGGTLW